MAAVTECSSPETCCLHSLAKAAKDSTNSSLATLLNVSLTFEDMQPVSVATSTEEEISRQIDALSSRLKIAQFITATLTQRTEELQAALTSAKQTSNVSEPEVASDPPTTSLNIVESSLMGSRGTEAVKSVTPILQRRHTTSATSLNLNLKDRPTIGWEERAAAFMMKRRSQKSVMEQQLNSPTPRTNPFEDRYFPRSPDARHTPRASFDFGPMTPSTPGYGHDQDVVWDLERRRQNPRRGALIAAGWITYEDAWNELTTRTASNGMRPYLTFATVPWPVFRASSDPPFREPSEITLEEVRDFLFSPFHSMDKSKETRVKETHLHFHPDKLGWINFVVLSERSKVKEGVERVNWCLNNLK